MITLQREKAETPQIAAFTKKAWEVADLRHYGEKIDWTKEKCFIQAYDEGILVGSLELDFMAGVMHILDVIVDPIQQQQGIGTLLMQSAETLAKEKSLHKIFLETGKTWDACKFYEKLGYKKTGDLPNHYLQQDYVEYSKFLKE